MSTKQGAGSSRCNRYHFDELDAMASRDEGKSRISNRQRRNQQRAAAYRNSNAIVKGPVPLPVVPVKSQQKTETDAFRLPGNQVWVCKKPTEWAAKSTDANDAISIATMLKGIPEISEETKIYRLLIGFVAVSDGTFGVVDTISGDEVPDLPIVGRSGFRKDTYRSRDINLGGKTVDHLSTKGLVWCLNTNKRDAKRVMLADYWVAISKPKALMPPENFLVDDQ